MPVPREKGREDAGLQDASIPINRSIKVSSSKFPRNVPQQSFFRPGLVDTACPVKSAIVINYFVDSWNNFNSGSSIIRTLFNRTNLIIVEQCGSIRTIRREQCCLVKTLMEHSVLNKVRIIAILHRLFKAKRAKCVFYVDEIIRCRSKNNWACTHLRRSSPTQCSRIALFFAFPHIWELDIILYGMATYSEKNFLRHV